MDTTNATAMPRISVISSAPVNTRPNFKSLIALSPNMTGTARKKVNSAAATRDTPIINAPITVAPEREVPGMMDNT